MSDADTGTVGTGTTFLNGHRKLLQALLQGDTLTLACAKAGRSLETIRRWRMDDPEFDAAVIDAIAEGKAARARLGIDLHLAGVRLALDLMNEEGKAPRPCDYDAAAKLAQAYDRDWATKQDVQHSGDVAFKAYLFDPSKREGQD